MIVTITLNIALDRTICLSEPLVVGKENRAKNVHLEPGGKGINVSRAIKALGGNSVALGFAAGTNGRIVKDALTAGDITHNFIDVMGQTRVNTQIIDSQGGHTEIIDPGTKLEDTDFLRLLDRMDQYLVPGNIFVLTGSCPPGFPMKNYREICKSIKKAGCGLVVDAAGEMLLEALKCEPDYVKPNTFELAEAVGERASADPEAVILSARKMLEMGAGAVCVSMSQEGAVFTSKTVREELYVNCSPKIYDIGAVGTGDAMVGALVNSRSKNLRFDETARFVVATGRACATLPGTTMATLKQVYEVYETTQVYTF